LHFSSSARDFAALGSKAQRPHTNSQNGEQWFDSGASARPGKKGRLALLFTFPKAENRANFIL
jgi:hypothetical protein